MRLGKLILLASLVSSINGAWAEPVAETCPKARGLERRVLQLAENSGNGRELANALKEFKSQLDSSKSVSSIVGHIHDAKQDGLFDSCETFDDRAVELPLKHPVSAKLFCQMLDWNSPYLVSPDVHQQTWEVRLATGSLSSSHIGTESPVIGKWTIRAQVNHRPTGALPKLTAGASPAYSLNNYDAEIVRVRLTKNTDL